MSVFICKACGHQVNPGEGYVHSNTIGEWRVDHTGCWPYPWELETCFAVPRHWTEFLSAHCEYANNKAAA